MNQIHKKTKTQTKKRTNFQLLLTEMQTNREQKKNQKKKKTIDAMNLIENIFV